MAGGIFIPIFRKRGDFVRVKVVADFRDRENDLKLRKKGETMEVTKDRAARLLMFGLVKPYPDLKKGKGGDPVSPEKTPG